MRDGVVLIADVYSMAEDDLLSPRPVILERTPYGRRDTRTSDQNRTGEPIPTPEQTSAHFVAAGYTVVRQDCRGRGDSGGEFVKYLNEGADGADTIEWISDQGWCDGRVFLMGVSYSAHVQTAAAAEHPRGLAGMFLDSGGFSSAYEVGMRMGGAFELKQATWAMHHALSAPEVTARPELLAGLHNSDVSGWFTAMPWRAGTSPLRHVPAFEDYLLEQWRNDRFVDYWRRPVLYARGHYGDFPDVPSLHMSSWYDPYVISAIENFTQLQARKVSPAYLVLGPWTHGNRSASYAGDVDFGIQSTLDPNIGESYLEFRAQWFDAHPRQRSPANRPIPPVRYFLMGGGSGRRNAEGRLDHGGAWVDAQTWPPPGSQQTILHLHPDLSIRRERSQSTDAGIEFDFDPRYPVPTIGGQVTSGEPVMTGGAFDQVPDDRFYGAKAPYLPLDSRADVVSFVTAPLSQPLVVEGPVSVVISLSSTAPDTDLTVKLVDVYPPSDDYPQGFAMNLTDGIFRCRFRDSFEHASALEPGEIYQIKVRAPDTANVFAVGHRLRLDVSSSNFPRFDVNSNTGEPESATRRTMVATNRIHLTQRHPTTLHVRTRTNDRKVTGTVSG